MAKQNTGAKPRRSGGEDETDLSGIETEIDEALEEVDDEAVDEKLDEALERADEDPDGALIELEGVDEDDLEGAEDEGSGARGKGGKASRK